ncbi:glycosyltransferase [Rossellomorea aquimaris]|uniref:glycosyltransferase family 2 protein n=1 Tax=Rossellomorea aquimaris TaxID=189382 RepID=UPI001CD627C6|nr:glycosyltransferase [Rossellomorea aquimaris]MCA1055390.1 glycosyltransferase [Rossellomorea aquimaris]
MILISSVLFILSLAFPLYHTINAYWGTRKTPHYLATNVTKEAGMSILVPCFNEEDILHTSLKGVQSLTYSNFELIYINDGSTDDTLNVLDKLLELFEVYDSFHQSDLSFVPIKAVYKSRKYPFIKVIDKMNGGKADSLNAGIALAEKDIVITLDADSVLDSQALSMLNQAFSDPDVIAVGGNVHVLQGQHWLNDTWTPTFSGLKSIVKLQILEYIRGFYVFKFSLAKSNALSIISGAFGAFKKEILLEVGGYRKTLGEDIDITLRVQNAILKRKAGKVLFIPEAICYTEVPESWRDLYNQRIRWQKAFIDCFVLYFQVFMKSIFSNKISFFFIVDSFLAGIVASYFTVFFIVTLFIFIPTLPSEVLVFYLITSFVVNLLYILVSIKISTDYGHGYSKTEIIRLSLTIVLDLFFFRFMNLLIVIIGSLAYFINHHDWNKVSRSGRVYEIKKKAANHS